MMMWCQNWVVVGGGWAHVRGRWGLARVSSPLNFYVESATCMSQPDKVAVRLLEI